MTDTPSAPAPAPELDPFEALELLALGVLIQAHTGCDDATALITITEVRDLWTLTRKPTQ